MPVRLLTDAVLAQLSGWPSELANDDLIAFFTLTDDDLGWLGLGQPRPVSSAAPARLRKVQM